MVISWAGNLRACLLALTMVFVPGYPTSLAAANSIEVESADTQLWLHLERRQGLEGNWSFNVNTGYKELWESPVDNDTWKSGYLSSSFSFKKNARLNFDLGSGLYHTARPNSEDLTEFRTWQGATAYWPDSPGYVRRFVLTHRFRLEQRFLKEGSSGGWTFGSRARYRMSTAIALNRKAIEPGAFYSYFSGEVFSNFSDNFTKLLTNRNRFSAGLGFMTPSKWTIELRYIRQDMKDAETGLFRVSDKILEFRVRSTVKIRDLMKNH